MAASLFISYSSFNVPSVSCGLTTHLYINFSIKQMSVLAKSAKVLPNITRCSTIPQLLQMSLHSNPNHLVCSSIRQCSTTINTNVDSFSFSDEMRYFDVLGLGRLSNFLLSIIRLVSKTRETNH